MPWITSRRTRKAASSLAYGGPKRRVVVTGMGLICAVGHNVPEIRQNLMAGKSGVATITHFDTTNFACTIAAEVKNFDPLNFIEKKEIKKMGRFIHLALAASDEAMKMCGLQVTDANATRVGVHRSEERRVGKGGRWWWGAAQ